MAKLIYPFFNYSTFGEGEIPSWDSTQHTFVATTVGGAGTDVAGTGTINHLAKWDEALDITDSIITDNGSTIAVSGTVAATTLTGSGAGITNIAPTNISSGTASISVSGNSGTVTNGVYTTGSYADPAWLTSVAGSKISGNITGDAANVSGTVAVANGGTGAASASAALANLGGVSGSGTNGTIAKWSSSGITNSSVMTESSSTVTVAGTMQANHIVGNTSAPNIAAGTSPTIGLTGTDLAGTITLTSGTLPSVSATVLTVTFNTSFSSAPVVVFSPANAAAALLSGISALYVTPVTGNFTFTAGTTALTAITAYKWYYVVIG